MFAVIFPQIASEIFST